MKLEGKDKPLTLQKFCMLAYLKEFKPNEGQIEETTNCSDCKLDILEDPIKLKNCGHHLHKPCLEDLFEAKEGQNKCPECKKVIMDGLDRALKIPKISQNKVTIKINKDKSKQRAAIIHEMAERC